LNDLELECFVKTTGSRGLHIVTPIHRNLAFDKVRSFAKDVARVLVSNYPEEVTYEQRIIKRGKRVFIDTLRNSYGQTAVAPYAVRAKPGAPVATPIEWRELKNRKIQSQSYNIKNLLRRLSHIDDPWQDIYKNIYSLEAAIDKLDTLGKDK
jgi:bifunctional non-homologous end joining protein LigD